MEMVSTSIRAVLEPLLRMISETTNTLLEATIRVLTTQPEPIMEIVNQGIAIGLIILVTGLLARYLLGESGSLTINPSRKWNRYHSLQVVAAVIGTVFYYSQIETASRVAMGFTGIINTQALLELAQMPVAMDTGLIMTFLVSTAVLSVVVTAALVATTYTMILLVLPAIFPILTAGVVIDIQPISRMFRDMIRQFRWVVYAGMIATPVLWLASMVASYTTEAGMGSGLLLAGFLFLMIYGMGYIIQSGPDLERRLGEVLQDEFPTPEKPDSSDAETEDGSTGEELERLPESGTELV